MQKLIQYVIVPKKPLMSKGKIASQVSHATFMALQNQELNIFRRKGELTLDFLELIDKWKHNGMCVVVLQCKDPLELFGIAEYLKQWNISHHLYLDEGITEVSMGTPTALATGILSEDKFWMFKTMKLFK